jgi:hypothetical protein
MRSGSDGEVKVLQPAGEWQAFVKPHTLCYWTSYKYVASRDAFRRLSSVPTWLPVDRRNGFFPAQRSSNAKAVHRENGAGNRQVVSAVEQSLHAFQVVRRELRIVIQKQHVLRSRRHRAQARVSLPCQSWLTLNDFDAEKTRRLRQQAASVTQGQDDR